MALRREHSGLCEQSNNDEDQKTGAKLLVDTYAREYCSGRWSVLDAFPHGTRERDKLPHPASKDGYFYFVLLINQQVSF